MGNKKTQKIYEISFHLVPDKEEEILRKMREGIKENIAKNGEIIGEEELIHKDLAYTIRHTVRQSDGSYNRYDEAYFGSIKFKASQDAVKKIEQTLRNNEAVLRFLATETVEEDTRIGDSLPDDKNDDEESEQKENKEDAEEKEGEKKGDDKK